MTSLKNLRYRIAGIKTTAKITQTMQMIASTELVKYKKLLSISLERKKILKSFLAELDNDELSELSCLRDTHSVERKKIIIVLGSDRGLCGGFNGKIAKALEKCQGSETIKTQDITLIVVGKKILSRIKSPNVINFASTNGILYTFQLACQIANMLLELSGTHLLDCKLLYSSFNNALNYEIIEETLLPLCKSNLREGLDLENQKSEIPEIDDQDFAKNLALSYVQSSVYHALVSSKASEESSRVIAMDGATKNSNQLTEALTLEMNKIRQSNITRELIEIVSSSQALK